MKKLLLPAYWLLPLFGGINTIPPLAAQSVVYVNYQATGAANGSSWADAYPTLQAAIDAAPAGAQIWVAQGVYRPTQTHSGNTARHKTFFIDKALACYGGFQGSETALDQRGDPAAYPTVLSGDLDADDLDTDGNAIAETPDAISGENAYHVCWIDQHCTQALLDGFVISAGQANGSGLDVFGGALLHVAPADSLRSELTLSHCSFAGNLASVQGGAVYNSTSGGEAPLHLTECSFQGNRSLSIGGALANLGDNFGVANMDLLHCRFSGNRAADAGGAIFCGSTFNSTVDPVLLNCIFEDNRAAQGGAVYVGSNNISSTFPRLINCAFLDNAATGAPGVPARGGAIYQFGIYLSISRSTFVNCTLYHNSAGGDTASNGSGFFIQSEANSFVQGQAYNCIFWQNPGASIVSPANSLLLSYILLENDACPPGVTCGAGMRYNQDPLFADTLAGDLRLRAGSPAIDAGGNNLISTLTQTDIEGNARIVNATGLPEAIVDLGAYEFPVSTAAAARPADYPTLLIRPNPAGPAATLEFYRSEAGNLNLSVFSLAGRVVLQREMLAAAGKNTWTLPSGRWANGIYRVVLSEGSQVFASGTLLKCGPD